MDGVVVNHDPRPRSRPDAYTAADNFLRTLRWARKDDEELRRRLRSFVGSGTCGESTAEIILRNVSRTVLMGNTYGNMAGEVFVGIINRSVALTCEAFEEKQHDEIATVVALGMLVIVAPWVVEALGFGPVGPNPGECPPVSSFSCWVRFADAPRTGTWAGKWQHKYSEYVPKGSLFTFFKRLDMEWS